MEGCRLFCMVPVHVGAPVIRALLTCTPAVSPTSLLLPSTSQHTKGSQGVHPPALCSKVLHGSRGYVFIPFLSRLQPEHGSLDVKEDAVELMHS